MKFKVDFSTILITFTVLLMFLSPIPLMILIFPMFFIFNSAGGIDPMTFGEIIVVGILVILYACLVIHILKCLINIYNKNCKSIIVNSDNIILEHKKLGNIKLEWKNIKSIKYNQKRIIRRIDAIDFFELMILSNDNKIYTVAISDYYKFSSKIPNDILTENCKYTYF